MRDTYYKVTYLDMCRMFFSYEEAIKFYNDLVKTRGLEAHIYKVHTVELSPGVDLTTKTTEIFPDV